MHVFEKYYLVTVAMVDFDWELQGLMFDVDGIMHVSAIGTTVSTEHEAGTEGREGR